MDDAFRDSAEANAHMTMVLEHFAARRHSIDRTKFIPALSSAWRERRRDAHILVLLVVMAILSWADLILTLFAHDIRLLKEMNPIAEAFLSADLRPSFICYKLLMVLAGGTMMWKLRQSRWAVPACWLVIVAHIALSVLWYFWLREVVLIYQTRIAGGF
jgi:hypothetical protein